jgi:membrane protease subunit HflC
MKPSILLSFLIGLLLLANSVFVVSERELAVLFQFGAVQRTDFEPGLHFKIPFVQNVRKYDSRILTLDSDTERYLTAESKHVLVDFYAKWRIKDVSKFYTGASGDQLIAAQRLLPIVRAALRREVSDMKLTDVVAAGRTALVQKLIQGASTAAQDLGVEVVDVRIKRIDLPNEVSESVYRRMRAGRERVANEFRSTGTAEAEAIRAGADRERQVILAEAERDSSQIRGDGEAQAAAIYAKAYGRDPAFFEFQRSLEAYRAAFADKNAVLVLDPRSEFFQYFGESGN